MNKSSAHSSTAAYLSYRWHKAVIHFVLVGVNRVLLRTITGAPPVPLLPTSGFICGLHEGADS